MADALFDKITSSKSQFIGLKQKGVEGGIISRGPGDFEPNPVIRTAIYINQRGKRVEVEISEKVWRKLEKWIAKQALKKATK